MKIVARLVLGLAMSLSLGLVGAGQMKAQVATGGIQGTVTDPDGALVPQAAIVVSSASGSARKLTSDGAGAFAISRLVPGRYELKVSAKGFTAATVSDVMVAGGKTTSAVVKLEISVSTDVEVTSDTTGVSTSPDENASALVIKGKDLDALSDDPDDLQNELTALAGPSAGPSGAQIYIDGFTGGELPPKSSILEIRINRNPFSAQYDKLGYGRIEIVTKPGSNKLHGSLMVNGNTKALNTMNPFVTEEPSYYSTFMMGNVSGGLGKDASGFASVFWRNSQSNSIINAEVPGANGTSVNYTAAVPNPQTRLDVSPRFDFGLGAKNTLSVRYMLDRQTETNSGVSGFALQSQGYNVSNTENTIQVSDTQIVNPRVVNDLRFQYMRERDNQVAEQTTPTETVQGAFTGGGNNQGTVRDNQDHYELQDYVTASEGKHTLNFGTRLRLTHEVNSTTSGFNGNYIYSSLNTYAAGTPSEYDVTAGNPTAAVNLFDGALFFQDDWSVRPNLTVSYGLRFEGQNRISNHADWAPRLSLSWAPGAKAGKKPNTVLRAGYGWFYDRFAPTYVLDAIHGNGVNQQNYVVKNPTFTTDAPTPEELASSSTAAPTIYNVAPNMKASVNMQAAVGVDHSFGKYVTMSATYINSRGVHQYLSDNINAYEAATYDPTTGTGVRPNGINENIYQFQSGGVYNQNQLMLNYTVRAKKVSLFGFYVLSSAKADTSGPTYFPSEQTNPGADYGRAAFNVSNRFLLGGNYQAPFGISISPFLVADSGTPFNITIGQDLNGDNQYNDRPAYATPDSTDTMDTAYGNFDLNPGATEKRIPYDLGTGPAQFSMNLRVSKSFGIGPRVAGGVGGSQGGGPGGPGGPGGGGHGPGGGAGGPGGGLGPGGLSGTNGPPRLDQTVPRRYSLTFSAMAHNVFNHVNLAAPVGVLESPLFGQSTALAGGFFSSAAANRSIDLQASFSF
jgi:hypothetical protein